MPFDAFISYSHKDKLIADSACAIVEAAAVRCWIAPRDIRPGADWGQSIAEAIDQCRVLVLIFSSNSNGSRQVQREVARAFNNGLTIVPVRIDAVEPNKALAFNIEGFHWLDALTEPREQYLRQLARHIKAILETQPERRQEGLRKKQSPRQDEDEQYQCSTGPSGPAREAGQSADEKTKPVVKGRFRPGWGVAFIVAVLIVIAITVVRHSMGMPDGFNVCFYSGGHRQCSLIFGIPKMAVLVLVVAPIVRLVLWFFSALTRRRDRRRLST